MNFRQNKNLKKSYEENSLVVYYTLLKGNFKNLLKLQNNFSELNLHLMNTPMDMIIALLLSIFFFLS